MGTELAINGKLGKKITWYGNYSYVRASFETHQKIASAGHSEALLIACEGPEEYGGGGNAAATADQESCEARESYQIQVGPGDAIPGVSPHIGRVGIGFIPFDGIGLFLDTEYNSRQFYRGDENNAEGKQVPGYFLLNASLEYTVPRANADAAGFSTSIFFEGRNLLDTNFETGGILAENEVDGTGGSGTFVTPGQPLTVFGGMKFTW